MLPKTLQEKAVNRAANMIFLVGIVNFPTSRVFDPHRCSQTLDRTHKTYAGNRLRYLAYLKQRI